MIANATAHRRANAFAQALDAQAEVPDAIEGEAAGAGSPEKDRAGRADPTPRAKGPAHASAHGPAQSRGAHAADRNADAAQEHMLALANALGGLPSPGLDPEVKTVQRAQLVAAMEAAFAGGTLDPEQVRVPEQRGAKAHGSHRASPAQARLSRFRPRTRWGRRLAVSGLAVGVAAGGFTGAAVASSDALPGDTLYGLKRSMEDLRLSMADDDTERGQVYLDLASTRLKEARRLMERRKAGPLDADQVKDVRRALSVMQEEAAQGHTLLREAYRRNGSLQPIEALAAFSDKQREHWSQLSPQLPAELSRTKQGVSSVLDAIEDEVGPLRSLLPKPQDGGKRSGGRHGVLPGGKGGSRHDGSHAPGSSSAAPAPGTADRPGTDSASPRPSQGDGGGLIGGGVLETPSPSGSTGSTGGKGGAVTGVPGLPDKEVTLPPLLPDLLPGLGLAPEDNPDD
ncbi:DUF5667 domain-containing protein [Wenjunlia tyrosinilytica]|uniref:DUF5667 domain-containing protein n=1 Tax=Wenjunlia tyrosinilytica TaxID=1544741 RepID=A0A917ZRI7_9ACTN|nr:DUF5667 domain-containing protein [Wenjunlia tyrosinilytica]GGO89665.1 hypothetical protein GCM10012280_33430 [Wenjunlia tyrosinilytica]